MTRSSGGSLRPVGQRKELFDKVKSLRASGLNYNEIIRRVEESEHVKLNKSQVSQWLTGKHRPDGSVTEFDPVPTFELGYVTGVALGDGTTSISSDHNYAIKLQVNDKDFAEEFARRLGVILKRPAPNVRWYEGRHAWRTQVSSLLLLKFLREPLSAIGQIVRTSKQCKVGFLRGFFDSEGSCSIESLTVCNGELQKLELVNELLRSLRIQTTGPHLGHPAGGTRMIRGKLCHVNKPQYYARVSNESWSRFEELVGFSIKRKMNSLVNNRHP
jgi:intein-encoded DNA endonuclease-like protein